MPRSTIERHKHPKYPRLAIELRRRSKWYQAITFLDGRKHQTSLKTDAIDLALKLAESWYRKLLKSSLATASQHPLDRLATTPTVGEVYASFRTTLTPSKRAYCDTKWGACSPFWRTKTVTDVTAQTWRDFYASRRRHKTQYGEPPSKGTLHKDATLIRQILAFAVEEQHLPALPPILRPGRIDANPRPWFTPTEWATLMEISQRRIVEASERGWTRVLGQRLDLHEMMQFMVASCVRVGECLNLRYADCQVERQGKKATALLAQVTGKRGTRDIVAPPEAANIISSRQSRFTAQAGDFVFPAHHRDSFTALLKAAGLRENAQGYTRNMKALRVTGISFRVLQGDNLLSIARNAGTSLSQLDFFYAKRLTPAHWKAALSKTPTVAGDTL